MKKYTNFILVGIIVVLAAVLTGTLVFLKNQPPQQRATLPLVEIKSMEPDSAQWGINFPNQYDTLLKTKTNNIATTYGGSSKFSHLTEDPRQVFLFAGYPFSKEYNDDRGHANALVDVQTTKRLNLTPGDPKENHATCYSCKSSDNPALWAKMGMEAYDATMFPEMTPNMKNAIGCANCHEAGTMRLIVTNPALENALKAQGKDWKTFSRQEMRSLVCANCHVEYYFVGKEKLLTFPWGKGTQIDQIWDYYQTTLYDGKTFSDWTYPETNTPMLKAQHPDYEMFTAGSTHFNAGVACADCHMPYVRDGAAKYSSHDVHSPLLNPEAACGQCHTDVKYVTNRVSEIQDGVYKTKLSAENAIIDAITAIKAATANPKSDPPLLEEARQLHRKAQFYWDFVSAENSMGFHNPDYIMKILAESTDWARQAQMKAAHRICLQNGQQIKC
ncbi:MAG: ammonia-forming cytochrome c nitrite reductase subunit c552 [Chloroflexi bacterium]|nr:ammonia-forming cytochrome c nitrite reductase subunit c552 [Chloroflexota bacterium]